MSFIMLSPNLDDSILFVLGSIFGRYLGFVFRLTPSYINYFIRQKSAMLFHNFYPLCPFFLQNPHR